MNVHYHVTNKCPDCGKLHSADVKENPPIISVKCEICGKFHPQESCTFIAVAGDISIGKEKGIIAGNVEDGVVKNVSIFCKGDCFAKACKEALERNMTVDPIDGEDSKDEKDVLKDWVMNSIDDVKCADPMVHTKKKKKITPLPAPAGSPGGF